MNEHAICLNCAHWDLANTFMLPVYKDGKLVCHKEYAACKVNAVTPDAPDCLPMMGMDGNCECYDDAFSPAADYLAFRHEGETQNDGLPVIQDDPANYGRRPHAAA